MSFKWRRGDTEAFNATMKAGDTLRGMYDQYQAGQAYEGGKGLGAVAPEEYAKYADQYAESNPEAAQAYREAAAANHVQPTREERRTNGLQAQADYYYGRGDAKRGGEIEDSVLARQETAANRTWRNEQQGQQRGTWDRETQGRAALAEAESYSPEAYAATKQRLDELGPEGEQARGLYKQHFAQDYEDRLQGASRKMLGLGDTKGANEIDARIKHLKSEGVDKVAEAIRSGATGDELLKVFNGVGKMRFDSAPIVEAIKDKKTGKIVDYRVAGSLDGKAGIINSLNEWEEQNMSVKERKTLDLARTKEANDKDFQEGSLRALNRRIDATGAGKAAKIDPELDKAWKYLRNDMSQAQGALDKLLSPKEGQEVDREAVAGVRERLSGYKIREYEILKKAGELPEGRTLREHIGLPAPDEDLPQLAALLAAGKMPDRQNADGTLTRGKPITADVLDSMISDVQKTYGKVAPEESARTIKKLRMMKAVNFDKGRPLGGGANEVADTRQHATY